jgi:hypothetical protein
VAEYFHGISQSLQANAGTAAQTWPQPLSTTPFHFIVSFEIIHSQILRTSLNKSKSVATK